MPSITMNLTATQIADLTFRIANAGCTRTLSRRKNEGELICIFGPGSKITGFGLDYPVSVMGDQRRFQEFDFENHFWFPEDQVQEFSLTERDDELTAKKVGGWWIVTVTYPLTKLVRKGIGMGVMATNSRTSTLRRVVKAFNKELPDPE